MDDNKSLVEQLHEVVNRSLETGMSPLVLSETIVGHFVIGNKGVCELLAAIADRIERDYLPRPRFEDGEVVKIGDMALWNGEEAKRVTDIMVEVYFEGLCGSCNGIFKRPTDDTMECIENDALKSDRDYWGCNYECNCCPATVDGKRPKDRYDVDMCCQAQRLDLLRRQREVLERGQE